jgi:hypothetical protein
LDISPLASVRIVGLNKVNVGSWWGQIKEYVRKATIKGPGALSEEELRHGCEKGYSSAMAVSSVTRTLLDAA